jgi:hypothetical protein
MVSRSGVVIAPESAPCLRPVSGLAYGPGPPGALGAYRAPGLPGGLPAVQFLAQLQLLAQLRPRAILDNTVPAG